MSAEIVDTWQFPELNTDRYRCLEITGLEWSGGVNDRYQKAVLAHGTTLIGFRGFEARYGWKSESIRTHRKLPPFTEDEKNRVKRLKAVNQVYSGNVDSPRGPDTSYAVALDNLRSVNHSLEGLPHPEDILAASALMKTLEKRRYDNVVERLGATNQLIAQEVEPIWIVIEPERDDSTEERIISPGYATQLHSFYVGEDQKGRPVPKPLVIDLDKRAGVIGQDTWLASSIFVEINR